MGKTATVFAVNLEPSSLEGFCHKARVCKRVKPLPGFWPILYTSAAAAGFFKYIGQIQQCNDANCHDDDDCGNDDDDYENYDDDLIRER